MFNTPCEEHWNAIIRILDSKGSPGKGLLYGHKIITILKSFVI